MLKTLLKILIVFELAYVIIVNAALQLPLTQTVVNMIRPEKFQASWDSAWTWYPTRVSASGVAANGQTRTQQWQLHAAQASASISLLPLILKRVYLDDVLVRDVDYRQRPRLKADRDYAASLPYYPEIEGREILPAETLPRKKKRPWKVSLSDLEAEGRHSYWIYQFSGSGEGSFSADLKAQSAGGPFSLNGHKMDITLDKAFLNGTEEVFSHATLSGEIGFSPFVPMENKGMRKLAFLVLDADIDLETRSLNFLNLFTSNLGNLYIDGAGQVRGRLQFEEGSVLENTDLSIEADDLLVNLVNLDIVGDGKLHIGAGDDDLRPLRLEVNYDEVEVTRVDDTYPFILGQGLALGFAGSNYVLPKPGASVKALLTGDQSRRWGENAQVSASIESAVITDLTILNHYLPKRTPLMIGEGRAQLTADVLAQAEDMSGQAKLQSTDLQLQYDEQQISGDLQMDLTIVDGGMWESRVNFSGSTVLLDEVKIAGKQGQFDQENWSAQLDFTGAQMIWQLPPRLDATAELTISDSRPVTAFFENQGFKQRWLSKALTLEDIRGDTRFRLENNQLLIPHAHALSDKVEVGAKAAFGHREREGVIYARYEKLDAVLKMSGEKNNLDVLGARKTYDRYQLRQWQEK